MSATGKRWFKVRISYRVLHAWDTHTENIFCAEKDAVAMAFRRFAMPANSSDCMAVVKPWHGPL